MLYADVHTEVILINFWCSLVLGSLIGGVSLFSKKSQVYEISSRGLNILKFLAFLVALISLLVIIRYWFYKLNYQDTLTRVELYSPIVDEGKLFSASYVAALYLKGIGSVFLSFILLRSLNKKDIKNSLIVIGIFFLDAFAFSAKGPFINIGFILLLHLFLVKKLDFKLFKNALIIFIFIFFLIWCVDLFRGNNITESVLRYFSIGPALLSGLVNKGFGFGYHDWSLYNLGLIFSGFEYLIIIIFRVLSSIPIESNGYNWVKYIDIPQVISESADKFYPANTFYTLLSEPYLSFGLIGVICIGFFFGWIITVLERGYTTYGCDKDLFWLQYLVNIVFFGIFVSFLSSVVFWLVLGIMFFFPKNIFKKMIIGSLK
jgi:oligosaccharide repeat unit polymerase